MKKILFILIILGLFLTACSSMKYSIDDYEKVYGCTVQDGSSMSPDPGIGSKYVVCDKEGRKAQLMVVVVPDNEMIEEIRETAVFELSEEKGVNQEILVDKEVFCKDGGDYRLRMVKTTFSEEYDGSADIEIGKEYFSSNIFFFDANLHVFAFTENPTKEDLDKVNSLTLLKNIGVKCE